MSEHQEAGAAELTDRLSGTTEVNAPNPMSNASRDAHLSPTVGTRQFVPKDEQVECQLLEVEKLIRRCSFNKAIETARTIKLDDAGLASGYALMVNEKISRAQLSSGDRHLARGDKEKARAFYQAAIDARSADPSTAAAAELSNKAVTTLVKDRAALIVSLQKMLVAGEYARWCGARNQLQDASILDHIGTLVPDIRLEQALEPAIPVHWPPRANPQEGWNEPVAIDDLGVTGGLAGVVLTRPTLIPGTSFATVSNRPIALDDIAAFSHTAQPSAGVVAPLRAASALPLIATMLTAHARLYALDSVLSVIGLAQASIPVYRYPYLREQATRLLRGVGNLDNRMLAMQFKLDDFSAAIEPLRDHLEQSSADYQALNARAAELQNTVMALTANEKELANAVGQLNRAVDDCDVEWWEVVVSVLVVLGATAIGALGGLLVGGVPGAITGGAVALVTSIGLTIKVWKDRALSCANVEDARNDFRTAQQAIQAAIKDYTAELNFTLLQRDAVIANLATLQYHYDEAMLANHARVLNETTLSEILVVLDSVRSSTVLRAHALARMAQDAYNAETDSSINVIARSHLDYLDKDTRGYTASALLQRDLDAVEHIRLTSRTRKNVQLCQSVSLRKHFPSTFGAILVSGQGRFATKIADFDRWYPGMYMQRLQEVQVEVLVDDVVTPLRGYLRNDGASLVRFADHGNKVAVDERNVFNEPDPALRQLCFKQRRRHHTVETMAFPSLASTLADARATDLQRQERNFFEGCGLESTWLLELLPDQQVDMARISDVRIHFQFEALFDPALKQVVEQQRYKNRIETALISVRELAQARSPGAGASLDFAQPIKANVNPFLFEAPHLEKPLLDVGIMLRTRQTPLLDGVATLRISIDGAAPVELGTDERGIVATAPTRSAGTNTAALQSLIGGKTVVGTWSIEVVNLPAGVTPADIDDILLMLRYSFKEPAPEPVPA